MAEVHTVRSYTKGLEHAPRKLSAVADLVRGRSVADALVILDHVPRRAALPLKKSIQSAKANATANHQLDGKNLQIKTLSVTAGPRLRRFKPASRGRALPFAKKSSHVLVELNGSKVEKKKPAAKSTTSSAKSTTSKAPKAATTSPASTKSPATKTAKTAAKPVKKESK